MFVCEWGEWALSRFDNVITTWDSRHWTQTTVGYWFQKLSFDVIITVYGASLVSGKTAFFLLDTRRCRSRRSSSSSYYRRLLAIQVFLGRLYRIFFFLWGYEGGVFQSAVIKAIRFKPSSAAILWTFYFFFERGPDRRIELFSNFSLNAYNSNTMQLYL